MEYTLLTKSLFEFLGTMVLILLGDGVCAGCLLNKTKSKGAGWIVVTLAWGFAVMAGILIAGPISGAHLNPAVSLGCAITGSLTWGGFVAYTVAQMLGGFVGAILVWLFYKDHYDITEDPNAVLCTFCTMPALEGHKGRNFFCEALATWLLVFIILILAGNSEPSTMPVTYLIMAIGMSLGGATGYAINPARDLAPRIAHAILPLKYKRDSAWDYSWVPVVGPMVGAAVAALLYITLF